MNRLDCNLDDNFVFMDSKVYNQIQFDIYNHPTQGMTFVYVNPETGLFKEIVYGPKDEYFYQTIEGISSYFTTRKIIDVYLELCRRELEEQNKCLERIEYYE